MSWFTKELNRLGARAGITETDSDKMARAEAAERERVASERRAAANGGIDPEGALDDQWAWLTREMAAEGRRLFEPLEDQANAFVLDPAIRGANRQQLQGLATEAVDSSFDRADSRLAVMRSRSNQAPSARVAESEKRLSNTDRAATTAAATTAARQASLDGEELLLTGRAS